MSVIERPFWELCRLLGLGVMFSLHSPQDATSETHLTQVPICDPYLNPMGPEVFRVQNISDFRKTTY